MLSAARWVSIALHPFVMALVMAGALEVERGIAAAARTVAVVGALFVLPLAALTTRQVRRGAWGTVDASEPRERPVLFAVGAASLLVLLVYFARARPGSPFVAGTAGAVAMVGLCAILTPWLKVSLHLAAAALAASVLLGHGLPLGWLLTAALPVLAWSRVALGRHRWPEVLVGLTIGVCTGVVIARFTRTSHAPLRAPSAQRGAAADGRGGSIMVAAARLVPPSATFSRQLGARSRAGAFRPHSEFGLAQLTTSSTTLPSCRSVHVVS